MGRGSNQRPGEVGADRGAEGSDFRQQKGRHSLQHRAGKAGEGAGRRGA